MHNAGMRLIGGEGNVSISEDKRIKGERGSKQ